MESFTKIDINHAADGGLYAELIRNRSFEDDITPCNWHSIGDAKLALVNHGLLNDLQHKALSVSVAGDGVCNEGYWGINAVKERQWLHGDSHCRDKRFSVENDRWYNLQVDVDADSIYCYLDGKLDLSCKTIKGSAYEGFMPLLP